MTDNKDAWKLVKTLHEVAEKLLLETSRLRGDIAKLADRFEPYENEKLQLESAEPLTPETPPVKDVLAAIEHLMMARRAIQNMEYDVSAIRARMTEISDDVMSREDIKPFLKRERK